MEMPVYDVPVAVTDTSRTTVSEIRMDKLYSGVYEVPCDINGLPLKFILDTGASTVSISSVEASVPITSVRLCFSGRVFWSVSGLSQSTTSIQGSSSCYRPDNLNPHSEGIHDAVECGNTRIDDTFFYA